MLSINFIGCGKLGKTLGFLLQHQRVATIGGIINTSLDSAQQACEFIGAGTAQMSLDKLPSADLTFIAVPDDHIKTVADRVANGASLKPGSIFVHCSNCWNSMSNWTILTVTPCGVHCVTSADHLVNPRMRKAVSTT